MTYQIEELSPDLGFGKIVRGLRSADIAHESVRAELRRSWVNDGLVVFCDGEISDAFQVELSRIFGPLERHPVREIQLPANPDLIRLTSAPGGDSTWVEVDGETGGAWLGWHSDLVYTDTINHGGLLRALKTTSRGGTTGFIDQVEAYTRLPQAMKDRVENLSVVYQMGPLDSFPLAWKTKVRVVKLAESARQTLARMPDWPPVAHPLVFTQPETGRKVLNLSPLFAKYIEGMQNSEGDTLLTDLAGHILDCPAYHHRWTLDEMVLWDNWRMLHSVTPAPVDETRVMLRTTIAGDYALGRKLDAPPRPAALA